MMKKHLFSFLLLISAAIFTGQGAFNFNIVSTPPPGFKEALDQAGERWTRLVHITVPVKVNIYIINYSLAPFSAITLANGRQNFQNATVPDVLFPTALANQIAGIETNPGESDMDIYFNTATPFFTGNGKPPASQMDLLSTAMHEIGHGLGFYSDGYVDANGIGSFGNIPASAFLPLSTTFPWKGQDSVPSIFDTYIVKASGNPLVTCAPANSSQLGDSIRLTPSYFSGPQIANASHNNTPVRLAGGTGSFLIGEDLLHVHVTNTKALMSYSWGLGDTVRAPLPYEMGILYEIGWKQSVVGIDDHKPTGVTVFPNPAGELLTVRGNEVRSVKIYDAGGRLVRSEAGNKITMPLVLEVSGLDAGIYLVKITTGTTVITRKVLLDKIR